MRSVTEALGLGSVVNSVEKAQQQVAEKRAQARLKTAFEQRDPHGPAKPTGVRIKGHDGRILDVYDDGSQRHSWKRKPGLSGRQFRKLRKKVNRNLRVQQREAQETKQ